MKIKFSEKIPKIEDDIKIYMDDPYLNDLRGEFNSYSNQLKKLRKKLLKTNSLDEQSKIIKQIDSIAKKMENNQKQSVKVTKSRLKERKKKSKK
jgi:predicted  nucleic acid-binding Zn-ribbon protein